MKVQQYRTAEGKQPVAAWLQEQSNTTQARVIARIDRLQSGLRGDWKTVGGALFELRLDFGPGYRVYCGQDGDALVILLCAGAKNTQQNDIRKAHEYWQDYLFRKR